MKTYKLGNKIKCTIRSFKAASFGDYHFQYENEPYTVLNDVSASLSFRDVNVTSDDERVQAVYDLNFANQIRLSNILLTDKILNLICPKNETKLCHTSQNLDSDDEKNIYLVLPANEIYEVFVYDDEGNLEAAYDSYNSSVLTVEKANSNYAIFYAYEGSTSYSLSDSTNVCVTLDLELVGNEDEETNVSWIHLEKCVLKPNKHLVFGANSLNTIDLEFIIADGGDNYITLA